MQKIALITDSACDLGRDIINKYNINVLPFRIIYENKEFLDGINIKPEDVYSNLDEEIPTSSLPSLSDMEKLFDRIKLEGYTHVIAITLSSGLSGIYNALRLISEDYPEIESFIFDSKSISLGEGVLVEKCGKMIEEGKSFKEIITEIPKIREKVNVFFVVGTLKYLKKGGRIGAVAGTIGEMLSLKPIITIDEDGRYVTYEKLRGRKQSLKKLVEIASSFENPGDAWLMHGYAEEEMENVYENLKKVSNIKNISKGGSISPVSGVHSGPGLIGLVYLQD